MFARGSRQLRVPKSQLRVGPKFASRIVLCQLHALEMSGVSAKQAAKRALVKVLFQLAGQYDLQLKLNRDSSESDVLKAFRRLVLKVHPDKGGSSKDFQEPWGGEGEVRKGVPEGDAREPAKGKVKGKAEG